MERGVLACGIETATPTTYFRDVHMVGESLRQHTVKSCRAEDSGFGLVIKREFGGLQDGALFGPLSESPSEQHRCVR